QKSPGNKKIYKGTIKKLKMMGCYVGMKLRKRGINPRFLVVIYFPRNSYPFKLTHTNTTAISDTTTETTVIAINGRIALFFTSFKLTLKPSPTIAAVKSQVVNVYTPSNI